jgi:Kae1-associated kinase Bud32
MGIEVIEKRRISKSYRLQELDSTLISFRTKEEAKLIYEARSCGVCVPLLFDIDLKKGSIIMEYLKGKRIKDILNTISENERKKICRMIGENVARLHNHDLIHGDITTSNMILADERIYFIDFGLGTKTSELEAKGVDLHVLMEAFESTHSKYSKCFDYVLEGYKKTYRDNAQDVIKKIDDIVKRGRYR